MNQPFEPSLHEIFGSDTDSDQRLSKRELGVVIARIHALMEFWGITLDDLEGPLAEPTPPAPAGPLPIKYRHPVSGETWDGQGPHPDWLRRALLQEGMRVEELKPDSTLNNPVGPAALEN